MQLYAKSKTEAELLIYGDIGESWFSDDSVTAKKVVAQLNALDDKVKTIKVRINSFGGSVSDGLAIVNALKSTNAKKIAVVEGVAVSCGSLIAMAADEIQMHEGSLMMIHAPWGGAKGNAAELRKTADVMDKWAEAMVGIYASKTGKPREEIEALLKDGEDHWYTAAEAVAAGFADKLVGEATTKAATALRPSAMFNAAYALYAARMPNGVKMSEPTNQDLPAKAEGDAQKDAELPAPSASCDKCGAEPCSCAAAAAPDAAVPEGEAPAPEASAPAAKLDVNAAVEAAVQAAIARVQAEAAEAIAKAKAEADAAQAKLTAEIEAKEIREAQAEAQAAFAFVPGVDAEFGSALRALRKASPDAASKIEKALAGANALLRDANAAQMTPVGSSGTADASPEAKVNKLAKELLASGAAKTIEQARSVVYSQHPDLLAQVRGED